MVLTSACDPLAVDNLLANPADLGFLKDFVLKTVQTR